MKMFNTLFTTCVVSLYIITVSIPGVIYCQVFNEQDQNAIVDAHNVVRRAVSPSAANMMEMKWSDCLATVGYNYLRTCQGILTHNPNRQTQAEDMGCEASGQFVGENLYWTSATTVTDVTRASTAWANERPDYDYATLACSDVCGHYTQMIWYDSYLVGCARFDQSNCNGLLGVTIICNYARGGNIIGVRPYTQGQACSECATSTPECSNDLCIAAAMTTPSMTTTAMNTPSMTTTAMNTASMTTTAMNTTVMNAGSSLYLTKMGFVILAFFLALL